MRLNRAVIRIGKHEVKYSLEYGKTILKKGQTVLDFLAFLIISEGLFLTLILVANSKSGERYHKKVFFLFSVGNINHL